MRKLVVSVAASAAVLFLGTTSFAQAETPSVYVSESPKNPSGCGTSEVVGTWRISIKEDSARVDGPFGVTLHRTAANIYVTTRRGVAATQTWTVLQNTDGLVLKIENKNYGCLWEGRAAITTPTQAIASSPTTPPVQPTTSLAPAIPSVSQAAIAPPAPTVVMTPEEEARQKFVASLKADDVRQIQTALTSQGFYKSTIDGAWGPGTEAAVKAWQTRNGVQASGILTSPQIDTLKKSAQASAVAPTTTAAQPPVSPQLPSTKSTATEPPQSTQDPAEREREIAERERQLAEREKQVAEKRAEAEQAERERQIAEREGQLAGREKQIVEKRAEEEALKRAAEARAEKARQLAEREKQLAEREKTIEEQERQLQSTNRPTPTATTSTPSSDAAPFQWVSSVEIVARVASIANKSGAAVRFSCSIANGAFPSQLSLEVNLNGVVLGGNRTLRFVIGGNSYQIDLKNGSRTAQTRGEQSNIAILASALANAAPGTFSVELPDANIAEQFSLDNVVEALAPSGGKRMADCGIAPSAPAALSPVQNQATKAPQWTQTYSMGYFTAKISNQAALVEINCNAYRGLFSPGLAVRLSEHDLGLTGLHEFSIDSQIYALPLSNGSFSPHDQNSHAQLRKLVDALIRTNANTFSVRLNKTTQVFSTVGARNALIVQPPSDIPAGQTLAECAATPVAPLPPPPTGVIPPKPQRVEWKDLIGDWIPASSPEGCRPSEPAGFAPLVIHPRSIQLEMEVVCQVVTTTRVSDTKLKISRKCSENGETEKGTTTSTLELNNNVLLFDGGSYKRCLRGK